MPDRTPAEEDPEADQRYFLGLSEEAQISRARTHLQSGRVVPRWMGVAAYAADKQDEAKAEALQESIKAKLSPITETDSDPGSRAALHPRPLPKSEAEQHRDEVLMDEVLTAERRTQEEAAALFRRDSTRAS